jgi:WD40 repeat protein
MTGSDDKTARVWDVASGKSLLVLKAHAWSVACVAFSHDGRRILTGSDDKTALVWDAASGQKLMSLEGHTAGLSSVAFAPDGRRALTASQDTTAKLWDIDHPVEALKDGRAKELLTLKAHRQPVTCVAFSPDGLNVLTTSRDGTAILWLATDWKQPAP